MANDNNRLTRRDFILGTSGIGLLWAGGAHGLLAVDRAIGAQPREPARSRVILARDRDVLDGRTPDPARLAQLLDRGVGALLQESDPSAAWRRLLSPSDVVGIKRNAWRFLPTPSPTGTTVDDPSPANHP